MPTREEMITIKKFKEIVDEAWERCEHNEHCVVEFWLNKGDIEDEEDNCELMVLDTMGQFGIVADMTITIKKDVEDEQES